jgi:hypothetical protein
MPPMADGGDRNPGGGEDEFSASMPGGFDGAGEGSAEFVVVRMVIQGK